MAAIPSPTAQTIPPIGSSSSLLPVTQVPITWAHLNLSGKLIYLSSSLENPARANIQRLDLVTGTVATIFSAPPGGWIYYATISPDTKQLIMSYQPPLGSNAASDRILYSMPLDATASPQPLFTPPTPEDHYT